MTTPPGDSTPEPGTPEPTQPPAPAPAPQRNGLALVGFILAIVVFPVGLIISLIALFQTFRRNQKGKVLAVLGTVISLAELTVLVVVLVWVVGTVAENVTTVLDPGCAQGKTVLLETETTLDSDDPDVLLQELDKIVAELDEAAAKAKNDEVRAVLLTLRDDYAELADDLREETVPAADFDTRIGQDADAFDELCTIGGAEEDSSQD